MGIRRLTECLLLALSIQQNPLKLRPTTKRVAFTLKYRTFFLKMTTFLNIARTQGQIVILRRQVHKWPQWSNVRKGK